MADNVKRYLDIQIYSDLSEAEKDRLHKEKERIRSEMSVEELESLKGRIDPREFHYSIKPLIETKKAKTAVA